MKLFTPHCSPCAIQPKPKTPSTMASQKSPINPQAAVHYSMIPILELHAKTRPNSTLFKSASDDFDDVTFKQNYDAILSTANYLYNTLNVQKGDVVTIALPNTWHYLPVYLGASSVGAIVSGMNPLSTPHEAEYMLTDMKSKIVITTAENVDKIVGLKEVLPNLEYVLYTGDLINNNEPASKKVKVIHFETVIAAPAVFDLNTVKVDANSDVFNLPYSSGTTGMPKGVMITHSKFLFQLITLGIHLQSFPQPQVRFETNVQYLPFYHTYGFTGLIARAIKGDTVVIMKEFKPEQLLALIDEYKVSQVNMVPGLFDVMAGPLSDRYSLDSLRAVACGGATLTQDQIEKLHTRLPNLQYVLHGYGMTEICGASHMVGYNDGTPTGSVGKLLSFMEHKIIDVDTQQKLGPNEVGEIVIRGPTVMKGYWNNPEATKAAFTEDGFLKTGDLARVDENDYVFIIARLKELIKVNATQVPPAEIETVLKQHPKIADAVVIGVPHAKTGEAPRAYVIKADESLTVDEVNQYTMENLSKYKQPTGGIEFIDEIPKNNTGKILRFKLKEAYLCKI